MNSILAPTHQHQFNTEYHSPNLMLNKYRNKLRSSEPSERAVRCCPACNFVFAAFYSEGRDRQTECHWPRVIPIDPRS